VSDGPLASLRGKIPRLRQPEPPSPTEGWSDEQLQELADGPSWIELLDARARARQALAGTEGTTVPGGTAPAAYAPAPGTNPPAHPPAPTFAIPATPLAGAIVPAGGDDGPKLVRPYAFTGGRTRSKGIDLPMETQVTESAAARARWRDLSHEHRVILGLCERPVSIAEISAHLKVPLGVARVLVSDMAEDGLVDVHGGPSTSAPNDLKLLERVLNGLRAL